MPSRPGQSPAPELGSKWRPCPGTTLTPETARVCPQTGRIGGPVAALTARVFVLLAPRSRAEHTAGPEPESKGSRLPPRWVGTLCPAAVAVFGGPLVPERLDGRRAVPGGRQAGAHAALGMRREGRSAGRDQRRCNRHAKPARQVTRAGTGVKVETVPRYYLDAGTGAGMFAAGRTWRAGCALTSWILAVKPPRSRTEFTAGLPPVSSLPTWESAAAAVMTVGRWRCGGRSATPRSRA